MRVLNSFVIAGIFGWSISQSFIVPYGGDVSFTVGYLIFGFIAVLVDFGFKYTRYTFVPAIFFTLYWAVIASGFAALSDFYDALLTDNTYVESAVVAYLRLSVVSATMAGLNLLRVVLPRWIKNNSCQTC